MNIKSGGKLDKTRKNLDRNFPTIIHYLGIILLIYAVFVDRNPGLIPVATGMIMFRVIYPGGENGAN